MDKDKKHLGDLPRLNAQNFPEAEDQTIIDVTAQEVLEQNAEAVQELQMDKPDTNPDGHANPTNPEKDATVTKLRADLEQARQNSDSQKQQIADLQLDLYAQKTLVKNLQKELEQVNRISADFEQAKKVALQLAEANTKLIEEVNALTKKKEDFKAKEYKKPEGKTVKFSPAKSNEPADFAANTWLL